MKRKYDDFIKSDLDEAEFFGVSRDNSITLDEYLNEMHDVDHRFYKIAKSEIESIKRKLIWVDDVYFFSHEEFARDDLDCIYIKTIEGKLLLVVRDKYNETFNLIIHNPMLADLFKNESMRDQNRKKEFENVQVELDEIRKIGLQTYKGKLLPRESISETFNAIYRPESGIVIADKDFNLFISPIKLGFLSLSKPIVKDKEKEKVYKKILLKK